MEIPTIGLAVAFAAGLLSFLSPCVLPIIPSYVTFITGMSLDELTATGQSERERARKAVLVHGLLFIVGFTAVFVIMGASATYLGSLFRYASGWIERAGGLLLIVFGLYLLGLLKIPGAEREFRFQLSDKPLGYLGTVLVGVTFAAGWTPCLGPVLAGIMTLAATSESVGTGIKLLSVYSAGLAIPFMMAALLLQKFVGNMGRMGRWLPWVNRISGGLLLVLGLLLITGSFTVINGMLMQWTPDFLLDRL